MKKTTASWEELKTNIKKTCIDIYFISTQFQFVFSYKIVFLF